MKLHNQILIGLGTGVVVGGAANALGVGWLQDGLRAAEPIGQAFIRLITMVVVPLVVASLLVGTCSLGDLRKLGRIGVKTIVYYMATTMVAVTIGVVLSVLVRPGSRIDPATRDALAAAYAAEAGEKVALAAERPSVAEVLLGMIPRNPVAAAANMELLPLIFFTILVGAALTMVKQERRDAVVTFAEAVNDAVMVIIGWVMKLAPLAVFVLIASVLARFGLDLLRSLLVYALTVVAGLAITLFGTYALIVRVLARMSPLTFYRRIARAPLVGFSTSSSNATLPVTMETAEKELGVPPHIASFVLPLGATINMDGTALYQAIATMFIAQIYGVELGVGDQATIVLTATLASVGTAGVPSAGIIMLVMVLQSVGLGAHAATGIALILGVDRILDMLRTTVNVTGDLTAAAFIARTEGAPPPYSSPASASPR